MSSLQVLAYVIVTVVTFGGVYFVCLRGLEDRQRIRNLTAPHVMPEPVPTPQTSSLVLIVAIPVERLEEGIEFADATTVAR